MSYLDKTRLLVAKREDESAPMIIGAFPMSTWEVIPPEEWDEWKRETAKKFFDVDWTCYDYMEIVLNVPVQRLANLYKSIEIHVGPDIDWNSATIDPINRAESST